MREGIQAAGGVDLQRARRIHGLRLSQPVQAFRQIDEGRRGPVGLLVVLAVELRDRAVNQAALGLVDAVRAADQRLDHVQHARAFAPDGIALGIVRVLDVERVDVIVGAFADLDALAAEPVAQGRELTLGVDDDQIVLLTQQERLRDLVLGGLALAASRGSQDEPVAVHAQGAVDDQRVAAPGVDAVEHAARLAQLLTGERNEYRGAGRGQGPSHRRQGISQGQRRVQSLDLHVGQGFGHA